MRRTPPPAAVSVAPIPPKAGIGLRFPHHRGVLAKESRSAWFEVHPENYLGQGVIPETLLKVRRDNPISLHATGLSLGSADGVNAEHLAAISDLVKRVEPGLISDHLSWSGAGGIHLPDLLPLPYTREALAIVARNIDFVQTILGRAILIENPSIYLAFADDEMDEGTFLAELSRRSGCGILLDVNNVAVSAANLGEASATRLAKTLDAVPAAAIGEIHLAGHAVRDLGDGRHVRIDDHGSPVSAEVWSLYASTIARIGARPTLIEWDTAVPDFSILAREAAQADAILEPEMEMRRDAAR